METWLPIKDYEKYYAVSNHGNVKSFDREVKRKGSKSYLQKGRILKLNVGSSDYLLVSLYKDGKAKKKLVHRLVGKHFLEGYKDGLTINHKDGMKNNNHYSNLEWLSQSENTFHAYSSGLHKSHGKNSHLTKHSEETVLEVRKLFETGKYKQVELAKMFGISKVHIHSIVRYKRRTIIGGKYNEKV